MMKLRTFHLLPLLLAPLVIYSCSSDDERPGSFDDDGGGGSQGGLGGNSASGGGSSFTGGSDSGTGGYPEGGVTCGKDECAVFASCVEEDGAASCECAAGYEGDGEECSDIDECEELKDACGDFATCQNTLGSFDCLCDSGFGFQDGACEDIDECAGDPCDINASCKNSEGSFECICNPNTYGSGFFCNNGFNDCDDDPCRGNGSCVQTPGGHACQCESHYQGRESCSLCGIYLRLSDPALEAAVNVQLGREADDSRWIPLRLLDDETHLDAAGFDVRELSGLECWNSLRSLDLSANEGLLSGAPVNALAKLTRLESLNLGCTGVTSLASLSAHPTLKSLAVDARDCGDHLGDPSAAGTIANLDSLDLRGHELSSLSFLTEARALRTLVLSNNQVSSLSDLSRLSLLSSLELDFNKLKDLDELSTLSGLQSLQVSDNQLSNLEGAYELPWLREVFANRNELSRFPDFESSEALRVLALSENKITSLQELAESEQLQAVDVSANEVETLDPLLEGSFRGILLVQGNPLDCEEEEDAAIALRAMGMPLVGACVDDP